MLRCTLHRTLHSLPFPFAACHYTAPFARRHLSSCASACNSTSTSTSTCSTASSTTVNTTNTTATASVTSTTLTAAADHRLNIVGLTPQQIAEHAEKYIALKRYLPKVICGWLYQQGVTSFDQMANISKSDRAKLTALFSINYGTAVQTRVSTDGTRKFLIDSSSGSGQIESVYIPMVYAGGDAVRDAVIDPVTGESRSFGAVCVSSQVGCSLQCAFCHTGTMDKKYLKNLKPADIIGQVMIAKHALGDYDAAAVKSGIRSVTNLVFMGMGEPLYNWRNLKTALRVLMDNENGLRYGRQKITVSTSGVVNGIDLLKDTGVKLAISLHATNDKLRDRLVPINKTFNIHSLMQACERYQEHNKAVTAVEIEAESRLKRGTRRITFEYVTLKGVNDSDEEAQQLAKLLKSYKVMPLVNLIPFNKWPGSEFECTPRAQVMRFADIVGSHGIPTTIRTSKGRDIEGACGQLAVHRKQQSSAHSDATLPSKSLQYLMSEGDPMAKFPAKVRQQL